MEGGSAPRRRESIAEDDLFQFQSIAEHKNKFSAKDTTVAPMAAMQCINGIVTDLAEYMNTGTIHLFSVFIFNIEASR
jgi:hypothetical protein